MRGSRRFGVAVILAGLWLGLNAWAGPGAAPAARVLSPGDPWYDFHAAGIEAARAEARASGDSWSADWTSMTRYSPAELEAMLAWRPPVGWERRWQGEQRAPYRVRYDLPDSFNWFGLGGMTPVKDQGSCGSCWDFGAVGALEAMIRIETGEELDLSEQQILSCATYGWGCGGGWTNIVWEHFRNGGAAEEACFPYQANDLIVCSEAGCPRVATARTWIDIPGDIDAIKTAIYEHGPVTSGFSVRSSFYYYDSGCYTIEGDTPNNHCMVICGWSDAICDEGAWLVKNSWGEEWGIDGYCWIAYGKSGIGTDVQQVYYYPGTEIELAGGIVEDGDSGDGDGWLDPGEEVELRVRLRNGVLAEPRGSIVSVLVSESPEVTVLRRQGECEDLARGAYGEVEPAFRVAVDRYAAVGGRARLRVGVIAAGGYAMSDTFSLPIGDLPILLVDDDGSTVADPFFRAALEANGRLYRHWDTSLQGPPTTELLQAHAVTIWATGLSGNLEDPDQAAVIPYLEGGGALLVSGQDIGWWMNEAGDSGDLAFYQDYLHAQYLADDSGYRSMEGVAGDPVADGLAFDLGGGEGSRAQDYPSWIQAREGAEEILHYAPDCAGALRCEGDYRLVYLAFGLEAIDALEDQRLLLDRALDWLVPQWPDLDPPQVTLLSPDGGEVWDFLDEVEITWDAGDESGIAGIDLYLSRDGGASYEECLAENEDNDGSFPWRVVGTGSTECRVRVAARDSLGLSAYDDSAEPFTILQPPADVDGLSGGAAAAFFEVDAPPRFGGIASLRLSLSATAAVRLTIHDLSGRELIRLHDGPLAAGDWSFAWDGRDAAGRALAGGVYFARLQSSEPSLGERSARLLLVR